VREEDNVINGSSRLTKKSFNCHCPFLLLGITLAPLNYETKGFFSSDIPSPPRRSSLADSHQWVRDLLKN
jgi:hypothetical protein